MTSREKQILDALKRLGGNARPASIAEAMGISADYAEQLCRDMVWMGHLVKRGLCYELSPV